MSASTSQYQPELEDVRIERVPDSDGDASYLEQDEFTDRLEAYNRGEFGFIGIQAVAQIRYRTPQGGWILGPEVRSPGLWSIEDDSDDAYLAEIGEEELEQLRDMLEPLGFNRDEINF